MMRHRSPRSITRIAHAPYNFVPLPQKVFSVSDHPDWTVKIGEHPRNIWECHDRWLEGKHSGWVELSIAAEAPLYVRCGVAPKDADPEEPRQNPNRQHFFHHGDENQPWIPGSSLRGMTRSLVEIMSLGKFAPVSDHTMFYRGVGDRSSLGLRYRDQFLEELGRLRFEYPSKKIQGGYLVRQGGGWAIRPAKAFHGETFIHVQYSDATPIIHGWGGHETHEVWVRPAPRADSPGHGPAHNITLHMAVTSQLSAAPATGLVKGSLVESGHMGETSYEAAQPQRMPRGGEKHMHCVVYEPDERAPLIPISEHLWSLYDTDRRAQRDENRTPRPLTEGQPLFYRLDGTLDFFGPTMMFRMPHTSRLVERIPQREGERGIDMAEAMFGTVGEDATIKGRVFFESARGLTREDGQSPFLELKSPRILGGPKPTAFQMYLEQPDPDDEKKLEHWSTPAARVRGWKRYWHRKTADFEDELVQDSQHTVIRPVRPGTTFSGRIRFENLNSIELGALLTALDLPAGKRHQIGMGKPRGLGTIRIQPRLHLLRRTVDAAPSTSHTRYERMLEEDGTFALGELPESEAAAIETSCRRRFESAVAGERTPFWTIPQMRELGAMLEWDQAPPPERTAYMELDELSPSDPTDPHRRPDKWWRRRPVLPLASEVEPRAVTSPQGPRTEVQVGETVDVVVRSDHGKENRPKFDIGRTKQMGVLHPSSWDKLPPDLNVPGTKLKLKVRSGGQTPQLEWIDPDAPPAEPPKPKPRGGGKA